MGLIDAEKLKDNCCIGICSECEKIYEGNNVIKNCSQIRLFLLRLIDEQSLVDAVEVVRCKDCEHWNQDEIFKISSCRVLCDGHGFEKVTDADFFCGHGVRREPVKPPEEAEDNFLMNRFLKVE